MPQGMLSIDVPIIVFHIANLWEEKSKATISQTHYVWREHLALVALLTGDDGAYMVMILGFLDEESEPVTLKAVPSGL